MWPSSPLTVHHRLVARNMCGSYFVIVSQTSQCPFVGCMVGQSIIIGKESIRKWYHITKIWLPGDWRIRSQQHLLVHCSGYIQRSPFSKRRRWFRATWELYQWNDGHFVDSILGQQHLQDDISATEPLDHLVNPQIGFSIAGGFRFLHFPLDESYECHTGIYTFFMWRVRTLYL